jgi:hypothetical protein
MSKPDGAEEMAAEEMAATVYISKSCRMGEFLRMKILLLLEVVSIVSSRNGFPTH